MYNISICLEVTQATCSMTGVSQDSTEKVTGTVTFEQTVSLIFCTIEIKDPFNEDDAVSRKRALTMMCYAVSLVHDTDDS